jgi:hypothetical protein
LNDPVVRPDAKIIPLMVGPVRSTADGRAELRDAVVQVIGHLVVEAVPPGRRSPLFDQAQELLEEAGWGLDELLRAVTDDRVRQALFHELRLKD